MTTVLELKSKGLKCFTHVDSSKLLTSSEDINTFKLIADKMSDINFVSEKIGLLEDAMWYELVGRAPRLTQLGYWLKTLTNMEDHKDYKKHYNPDSDHDIDPTRKANTLHKGILSAVLRKTEKDNGFGDVSYAWGVGADAFLNNLKARRPFKDYSASVTEHGEYTHRIQWWIVCNHVLLKSSNNAHYFEECAYWICDLKDSKPPRRVYLWDYLFDSAPNTTGLNETDSAGRSPIKVFELCQNKSQYPMLAAFLTYRVAKAQTFNYKLMGNTKDKNLGKLADDLTKKTVPPGVLERAARRFLNKSFESLDADKQTELHDLILEKGFTNHSVDV